MVAKRRVVIKPVEDAVPDVSIDVKTVRKTNQGYMVTPYALVPLEAKVADDYSRGFGGVHSISTNGRASPVGSELSLTDSLVRTRDDDESSVTRPVMVRPLE